MAKVVSIMDLKDDKCDGCDFCFYNFPNTYCGKAGMRLICADRSNKRPDWCPLVELPERKDVHTSFPDDPVDEAMTIYFNMGWNACIDVLEGKE